jgi:oligopeptidase B
MKKSMSNSSRTVSSAVVPGSTSQEFAVIEAPDAPSDDLAAPVARRVPHYHTIHGEARVDEYFWLRDRNDPEVISYLQAENRFAAQMMRHTEPLQEQLYHEMRSRIKEADLSVPERLGHYLYYNRTEAGGQYPILCRRRVDGGSEEVLLDQNSLAAGHSYFRLGASEVSPDHRLLAYSVDTTGSEQFVLYVKDLMTDEILDGSVPNTSPSLAWANDSDTLFYIALDQTRRPCRLYRHLVGTRPTADVEVYLEPDPSFHLEISHTRSRRYLLLDLSSHSTSEVRFVSADAPEDPFRLVQPREAGVEYSVSHHGDRFFITTNAGAPNFRLVQTPVLTPGKEYWTPVLPYRPEVKLDGTDAFRRHLVIYEREAGLRQVRILELDSGEEHLLPFPEPTYTVLPHRNPEFDTRVLRFTYSSLLTPSSVIEYDMADQTWSVRKQTDVLGGYDPSGYRSERRFAVAEDGALVPISLVYRLPFEPDGTRPVLLNGYGAYGLSYEPVFSVNNLSLLERGVAVAIAHVRGGEEMGRAWYEGGRRFNKSRSFTDFIAVAEHLVAAGYTSPERLIISGGSAGGLLMGAVTNMRPDLFSAVLAEVPFVDVLNTMLDASLPLTVIEYDEWGNPHDSAVYHYMRTYSPYDNVQRKQYPHMLVTAGLNDPRVAYWEPAKWTAKLRAMKLGESRLLFRTNMGAGHGGASGRYDTLRETAFKFAFVLDVLQLPLGSPQG